MVASFPSLREGGERGPGGTLYPSWWAGPTREPDSAPAGFPPNVSRPRGSASAAPGSGSACWGAGAWGLGTWGAGGLGAWGTWDLGGWGARGRGLGLGLCAPQGREPHSVNGAHSLSSEGSGDPGRGRSLPNWGVRGKVGKAVALITREPHPCVHGGRWPESGATPRLLAPGSTQPGHLGPQTLSRLARMWEILFLH